MYIIIAGSYKTDQQSSKGTQVSKPLGQTLKHESLGQPLGFKWRPFCLPDLKPPELSIGSPRHDFIDSGKSRMKRHAYAISGIQPLEHISRAPRGVATQDGMVTHPHTTHDADGCLHETHQAKPTDACREQTQVMTHQATATDA